VTLRISSVEPWRLRGNYVYKDRMASQTLKTSRAYRKP
jgi:hypothetical protein